MTSTIQQRREAILSLTYQSGHVTVRQISQDLNVSEPTIRRDLHSLAAEGLLELKHGGASVVRTSDYSFISKSMRNIEAKRVIAQMACDLISDGEQLFIDSGTTCFEMTSFLRSKRSLSVIVNSVRTAQELQAPGVNVLLLGGQYRPDRMDAVGPITFEVLERLRGYRAFLGTDGVSLDFGLTSVDIDSAHIFTLAARNARECILLADSSKFDQPSLYKITDFNCISTVVTEKKPSSEWEDFFAAQNIKVLYPNQNSETENQQQTQELSDAKMSNCQS
ncbi:MAG: DeoR/GlpR transcriptional regulator [Phycisphaerae bacterium]|nr:DeoR/GlpR transcriptional regulator [Phycisphaerae bacterium]